ncbi:hypothetical protein [Desertimonas flava]|uniref:hypothetical protein n=1 Tax=Desertimonas flava TaxID=2064846 RepID=UPI000E351F69|nr:hypothetical protein [Desertimonas flava]
MTDPVTARANELLETGIEALAGSIGGAPGYTLIAPGDHAWDQCCQGAMWVRIVRIFPYASFPNPIDANVQVVHCPAGVAAELELVSLRCLPNPQQAASSARAAATDTPGAGKLPSTVDLEGAATKLHDDGWRIVRHVVALLAQWRDTGTLSTMTPWVPLGPEGGCVGGALTVIVQLSPGRDGIGC